MPFTKATKRQSRLRMAIDGPSGSGKTFTALTFASTLGAKVAVIDTERGSASKYADMFSFDVLEMDAFGPQALIAAVHEAEQAGYDVIVIDSLSMFWEGKGGILDLHDQATKRSQSGNSFTAWKDITPLHRSIIDAMLGSTSHVIATMRSKMDYQQSTDERGKSVVRKIGMAPVQRNDIDYEFDIVADLDIEHTMIISKTRCFAVADNVVKKPTAEWFATVKAWLSDGAPVPPPAPKATLPLPTTEPDPRDPHVALPAKPAGNGHTEQAQPVAYAGVAFTEFIVSEENTKKFLAAAAGLDLTERDVLTATNKEHLAEIPGTKAQVWSILQAYAAAKKEAAQSTPAAEAEQEAQA